MAKHDLFILRLADEQKACQNSFTHNVGDPTKTRQTNRLLKLVLGPAQLAGGEVNSKQKKF